jgi:hypothetical protein
MRRYLNLISLAAVLAMPPAAAFAYKGTSSGYGTLGYGPTVPTRSLTPFQRSWNAANQSKFQARESAEWVRQNQRSPFW